MAFPAVTVTAPTLSNWEAYYNGITFGLSNPYAFHQIDGLFGNAPIKSGDVQRPRDQGEFIGLDLYQGRDFTVDTDAISNGTSLQSSLENLGSALLVGGTTELPFYVQLPNLPLLCTMARCRKYAYPINLSYGAKLANPISIAFHSTDPRLYTAPTQEQTAGLSGASVSGASFNWSFNLSFGGSVAVSHVNVANSGNYEIRPIVVIAGPCTTPTISNQSIAGIPSLTFNLSLNNGDIMTVDMDAHTVVLNGVNRLNTLAPGFQWWNLPANSTSTISFTSLDGTPVAGTMTVEAPSGAWVF